jgi:membrane protein CcdC involved in cytochrome C biogenesis
MFWELGIAFLLIAVCIIIPFRIALNLDEKYDCYGLVDEERHNEYGSWEIGI